MGDLTIHSEEFVPSSSSAETQHFLDSLYVRQVVGIQHFYAVSQLLHAPQDLVVSSTLLPTVKSSLPLPRIIDRCFPVSTEQQLPPHQ